MKYRIHKLFLLFIIAAAASIAACKKNQPTQEVEEVSKPEAIATFDSKSGGIYKGTVAGSSGTFKIVLQNGSEKAEITFDGVTKTLTPNLGSWTSGQAINKADFSSGDWHLIFSVDADGKNPIVTINIPGHVTVAVVFKETSANRVDVFEGTYSGLKTAGTFNLTTNGNTFSAVYKGTFTTDSGAVPTSGKLTGIRNGNSLTGENGTINGTISGETLAGVYRLIEKQLYVKRDSTIGERVIVDVNINFTGKRLPKL